MNDKLDELINRASHLIEIERWREAIDLLLTARSIEPGNASVNALISQAYLGMNDHAEGLKYADLAVTAAPDSEWGHRLRSVALQGLGRKTEALEAAKEAARLDPEEAYALATLAEAQMTHGELHGAGVTVEKLREMYPGMELSHFTIGNYYLKKGDHRSAEKSFRRALELNPLSSESRNNLAIAMMRKDERVYKPLFHDKKLSIIEAADPDEIHKHLGEAIKLDPTSDVAITNFRNQFRYAFPIYLAIGLVPFWAMVLFVNPFWALIWTIIFFISVLQAFRDVRRKRSEIADDLKPILANLPKLSLAERLREIRTFLAAFYRKTWPAYALVFAAVFIRNTDFGGGPPPTYKSTWNVGLAYLMAFGSAIWLNVLLNRGEEGD